MLQREYVTCVLVTQNLNITSLMVMKLKVFVASPSDVTKEREYVRLACTELNRTLGKFLDVELELLDWVQVPPGPGRSEDRILKALKPELWDIFIGIFWLRFGSPTGEIDKSTGRKFLSGTHQEFAVAYKAWQRTQRPYIMLYRCERLPKSLAVLEKSQYRKVAKFFAECAPTRSHPCHYRSYKRPQDFERAVRLDLAAFLIQSNENLRRKLADMVPRSFLQVLLPKFRLSHIGLSSRRYKQVLKIELDEDLSLVTDSYQRQDFHEEVRNAPGAQAAKSRLEKRLKEIRTRKSGADTLVDCPDWRLRYANGGVLPIVRFGEKRYFALFYREVFPTGWNIANGGSDNYQEILYPERVLLREFSEELLIVDESQKTWYCFKPGQDRVPLGYQKAAIRTWASLLRRPEYENYHVVEMPVDRKKGWEGPDTVQVRMKQEESESTGCFLSITPGDNAIEVDRVTHIELKLTPDHKLFDGEVTEGLLVGRIIGLFDCERLLTDVQQRKCFLSKLKKHPHKQFRPDFLFFNGEKRLGSRLVETVGDYRARLQPRRQPVAKAQATERKYPFRLCPITRAVITRFLEW
jgi:hypothetical protein